MENLFQDYFSKLAIGGKQSYKNMAVFPLLSNYSIPLEYLTLDDAVSQEFIDVVEVDEGGHVPELKVKNKSPLKVLIIDGEELVGAKQNRIVNTTILVKEESTIVIPVSCVERGRWAYNSDKFNSKQRFAHSRLRAMKAQHVNESLRNRRSFDSDQGAIWEEIDNKARRRGAESASMEMGNIYERDVPHLEKYAKHFKLVENQVGAIFVINDKIAGMDSFGKADTFAKIHEKLLNSYTLDAIDWYTESQSKEISDKEITEFLDHGISAKKESRASVQLGTDYRLQSEKVTGFSLAYENQVLHFSLFIKDAVTNQGASGMGRFSHRMRNRDW